METNPKFYLELARVTGCTWPWKDEEIDPSFHVDSTELDSIDPSQFIRLSLRFLDASERQFWITIKSHCRSVYQSECFFRCISEEQWLRTVVTCNISDSGASVHSIHSNVMPKQAYLTWFEGTKVTCPQHQCNLGFFQARRLLKRMMESNTFPEKCCSNCAFEDRLGDQLVAAELVQFWFLEETDVRVVDDHTEARSGSEGEVRKILWRHGTFARKRFVCNIPYQNTNFVCEFDIALKVSHPNIVHTFGWSDGSSNCSLFMEWLEVDLQRLLLERREDGTQFSFQETLVVLLQVAEAVKYLHEEGFVHGDLKPGNLLMSEMAMPPPVAQFYLVKVADFGCTQRVEPSSATAEPFSYKIGTQFYTAPEVLRCRIHGGLVPREQLYKIDVYSFGVVAYQVVTGVVSQDFSRGYDILSDVMRPDEDEAQWRPNRDFNFDVLGDDRLSLLPLIKSCWASSPHERPTFQEICRDLRELYNRFFPEQVRR